jgi:hypothetical protein
VKIAKGMRETCSPEAGGTASDDVRARAEKQTGVSRPSFFHDTNTTTWHCSTAIHLSLPKPCHDFSHVLFERLVFCVRRSSIGESRPCGFAAGLFTNPNHHRTLTRRNVFIQSLFRIFLYFPFRLAMQSPCELSRHVAISRPCHIAQGC